MTSPLASSARIPALDGWRGVAFHALIFFFAVAIVIARRPDAVFRAQFYAEDGQIWFADAYNQGWWRSLFQPHTGYFQTLPRLAVGFALLVPFSRAPLVLNSIAIAFQAMPAVLLISPRSSEWGTLRFRAALAAMYLALPNNFEISMGITESQWILVLISVILVEASTPQTTRGKAFDASILTLSGLTGPFCLPLLLIAVFAYWTRRDPWRRVQLCIIAAACLVQLCGLLIVDPNGRNTPPLGATPEWFIRILSGQVYLGALLGPNQLSLGHGRPFFIFLLCVAILGTVLIAKCVAKSSMNLRLFLIFSAILFTLSLASPIAYPPPGQTKWEMIAAAHSIRYWFFPTLAFAWSLLWCARSQSKSARIVSRVLLFLMCFGVVRDFRHPPFVDEHFAAYAQQVESASPGEEINIPENPRGWKMQLVKR